MRVNTRKSILTIQYKNIKFSATEFPTKRLQWCHFKYLLIQSVCIIIENKSNGGGGISPRVWLLCGCTHCVLTGISSTQNYIRYPHSLLAEQVAPVFLLNFSFLFNALYARCDRRHDHRGRRRLRGSEQLR